MSTTNTSTTTQGGGVLVCAAASATSVVVVVYPPHVPAHTNSFPSHNGMYYVEPSTSQQSSKYFLCSFPRQRQDGECDNFFQEEEQEQDENS